MKSLFDLRPSRRFLQRSVLSVVVLAVFALSIGLGIRIRAHRMAYHPNLTEAAVIRRALSICAGFSHTVSVVEPPTLRIETLDNYPIGSRRRYLWYLVCDADGRRYNVLINDKTGNMSCLIPEDPQPKNLDHWFAPAVIKTAGQAAWTSIDRIREMQMLPRGTQIKLDHTPERRLHEHAWQVVWNVHQPDTLPPYQIRLRLDWQDGTPLIAVNRHELETYPAN